MSRSQILKAGDPELWEGLGPTLPPFLQHPFPGGCPGNQAWTPQLASQAGANILTSTTGSVEYCLRRSRTSGLPIAPRASPKKTSQSCRVSMVSKGCMHISFPAGQSKFLPQRLAGCGYSSPTPPEAIGLGATQALGQENRVCQDPEARNGGLHPSAHRPVWPSSPWSPHCNPSC